MPDTGAMHDLTAIREVIAAGETTKAVVLASALHPADLAALLLDLEGGERRTLEEQLPPACLAEAFSYASESELADLVAAIGLVRLPAVLALVEPNVAADALGELDAGDRGLVLALLPGRREVEDLLGHGRESAGGIMSPATIALPEGLTVGQAIARVRDLRPAPGQTPTLFLVDADGRLTGTASVVDLVLRPAGTTLSAIADRRVHSVPTAADQEEAARLVQRYDLAAVPVVDEDGRLQGAIAAEELMDVLQEEATEDMYRMVGLPEEEQVLGPLSASLRRRIPWLLLNLLTAFAAAAVVAPFEGTIAKAAALAVFMPVIAGHAGNTGTQVATLVVRGLALGEVRGSDFLAIMRKELAFGVVHGVLAGLMTAVLALIISANPWLGGVVFVALVLNVLAAGLLGAAIPLVLRKLNADPALASSIWLTTFTDVLGFVMLLGFGALLLSKLD